MHQTLINSWKREAVDGMAGVFSGKAEAEVADREAQFERLHAKIGLRAPGPRRPLLR